MRPQESQGRNTLVGRVERPPTMEAAVCPGKPEPRTPLGRSGQTGGLKLGYYRAITVVHRRVYGLGKALFQSETRQFFSTGVK